MTNEAAARSDIPLLTLPSATEALITRWFAAPPSVVWTAMTEPDHVRRWYGTDRGALTTCDIDLRVGGGWHYVQSTPEGDHSFSGEYLLLDAPHRVKAIERYDNIPGAEYRTDLTLTDEGGGTLLRNLITYAAPEVRDGHLGAGMQDGLRDSFAALDDLVTELAARS